MEFRQGGEPAVLQAVRRGFHSTGLYRVSVCRTRKNRGVPPLAEVREVMETVVQADMGTADGNNTARRKAVVRGCEV